VPSRTPNLPKNLFIFWDKGFDSAPDICQYCLQSWRDMNPSWQINVLDQESANDIVYRNSFPDHMKIAHYADVLRTNVLATKGGVWADATLLCLKPLDDWLPLFFCQSPFFVFYRPGKDRMLSNWFISAESSSILIEKWCDKTNKYWYNRTSKADTYFGITIYLNPFLRHRQMRGVNGRKCPKLALVLHTYSNERWEKAV